MSYYTLSTNPRNSISISDISSIKGSRRVLLLEELTLRLKKPEPILVSTLEEDKNNKGDIIIKDLINIIIPYLTHTQATISLLILTFRY